MDDEKRNRNNNEIIIYMNFRAKNKEYSRYNGQKLN